MRWGLGRLWAGPEASLSHEAAKPWVGCWLPGSRVVPGTWAVLGRVAGWARPVSYTLGPEWVASWLGWA